MSRVYIALDLTLSEGRGISQEVLREILEEALPDSVEDRDTVYTVSVLGVGSTVKDMQKSMALRRNQ